MCLEKGRRNGLVFAEKPWQLSLMLGMIIALVITYSLELFLKERCDKCYDLVTTKQFNRSQIKGNN